MSKEKKLRPTSELYSSSDISREVAVEKEGFDGQDGHYSEFRRDYARLVHCASFRRLQGKTQLFPGIESDFFRNRLTHSMEVAQIAKGIATQLNQSGALSDQQINTDLVELAALSHDIGHPPFGHNGEYALDECMREFGGFEGNAQTLRIVTRLEKRDVNSTSANDRCGLNLTYRSIAAMLKYDQKIPLHNNDRKEPDKLAKGYYASESDLILKVKKSVAGDYSGSSFRTIECDIMDIADDIAYSTYDLEDAFKAGFFNPLEILNWSTKTKVMETVAEKVTKAVGEEVDVTTIRNILFETFGGFMVERASKININDPLSFIEGVIAIYSQSKEAASNGFLRTQFTSELVKEFIKGVSIDINTNNLALSKVRVSKYIRAKIEALKHLTFEALTMAPRMRLVEYRGRDIVKSIFLALASADRSGHLLLPDDWRDAYFSTNGKPEKMRVICDFVAGMTDRYAMEFFARLTSTNNEHSFFKPY
ncbi:dGTP triphosphohydrolase [Burkholderia cenocepacia]|uniref:dGTP triphosphohydrolase n=1 Tax=Burkholderia cenocepacia TaxID=95486 RepID=UPI001AA11316|nr:dNTP triphosphohydrolase [Burkholderia cenocepacia]MBO1852104.1 dNTP triphosphohydrolase [Burkholderia cenocepacia]MCO8326222.1 dNTP triphosphohydrolase [Burkholderia cenocepacia]MCO8333285.1 dNTP triphosphohydrolase [Burkholderia cenocepacia]MCO8340659.1 dNTP triphosphohydrolase [Burkholderia cenocepacia]MCO8348078.1 dNTP triphosphohydrolase [Burkholderia cenocepacia]